MKQYSRAPPISLALNVSEDDVLDRGGHARDFPRNVGLPAPPRLRQVLQNRLRLVLLDRLRHHVEDVVHDGGAEFKVVMRLHTLLGHRLRDAFAVTTLELTRGEITKVVGA